MATSRSASDRGWIGGAFVYSGRPDPTWPIRADVGEELAALWEALPSTGATAAPPALGYRGCYVRDADGRTWTAYGELVTFAGTTRRDDDRRFQRIVLASAPAGVLPPSTGKDEC